MSELSQLEIQIEKGGEDQIADDLVKLLLNFAKDKTVAGYFLIRNNAAGAYSVSSVEWTQWKKEEDLRKFLLDNLREEMRRLLFFP